MPSIKDKLTLEERNERTIHLWPEGKFFKAYERSAYLFVTHVKSYEVRCRYVDVAGCDVLHIGFPQSVIDSMELRPNKEDNGSVTLQMKTALDEQQYLLWREAHKSATEGNETLRRTEAPRSSVTSSEVHAVISRLRTFNLASSTPLDCLLLVSELQKMISEKN